MGVGAAVLGASGYSGGELLRYLAGHPAIDVSAVAAGAKAGRAASGVLPHLAGAGLGRLGSVAEVVDAPADILFSCLPPGHLPEVAPDRLVIDLSDDALAGLGIRPLARVLDELPAGAGVDVEEDLLAPLRGGEVAVWATPGLLVPGVALAATTRDTPRSSASW
ncbi:MAG: hypothetical protein KY463_12145, partial [Actinobacteria bacterium]|nr:hypothetical protein [Actinomycetota bacterium]